MRRTVATLALAAGLATTAQAQRAWQSEIGIQGGFVRIKPAGSGQSDHIDAFGIPGSAYVLGLLTHGTLYVVIPWKDKVAIEPSFVITQLNGGVSVTAGQLGLRANYALTPKVYAALGGELLYLESSIQRSKQLGLLGAVGYRTRLTGPLNARLEARVSTRAKTEELNPNVAYGLLFGVSTRLGGTPAATQRRAVGGRWQRAIGISGGYTSTHRVGGADVSGISVPGLGGSVTAATSTPVAGPPTLFAIFPIGTKTAIEPGLDIVRVQQAGSASTLFSGNFSARLNYALSGGWYAAAGGNLNYLKATGADAATIPGLNLAWGYRFPVGGWGGRVELHYAMFGKNADLGVSPQNVFGILVGASMPLR